MVSILHPDTEPPIIIQCPSEDIDAELSPDTLIAEVNFLIPQATDNSAVTPRIVTSPDSITSPYYHCAV